MIESEVVKDEDVPIAGCGALEVPVVRRRTLGEELVEMASDIRVDKEIILEGEFSKATRRERSESITETKKLVTPALQLNQLEGKSRSQVSSPAKTIFFFGAAVEAVEVPMASCLTHESTFSSTGELESSATFRIASRKVGFLGQDSG